MKLLGLFIGVVMASEYMQRPTPVLMRVLGISGMDTSFQAGRLAMALEIVTVIRTLDEIPSIMSPTETSVVQSVLTTLLNDQNLGWAFGFYDELSANRRVAFAPEPSREGISVLSLSQDELVESLSSDAEVLEGSPSLVDGIRKLLEVRRSRGDEPSVESEESSDESTEATSSG
jgi:hypothetical protein